MGNLIARASRSSRLQRESEQNAFSSGQQTLHAGGWTRIFTLEVSRSILRQVSVSNHQASTLKRSGKE